MFCQRVSLISLLIFAVAVSGSQISAQQPEAKEIYLKEASPDPPASVARRQKAKEEFDDGTVRIEREVAQLSDDTVINDGTYVEYYRGGQKFSEGTFDRGVLDGVWKYWYENGQLCKAITYRDGKPHGKVEVFRPDGTLEAVQSFSAGVRDGEWAGYYEDGESIKVKFSFQNGKMTGDRVTYYQSGQKRQLAQFENGQLHGEMVEWDESGNKKAEARFYEGKVRTD